VLLRLLINVIFTASEGTDGTEQESARDIGNLRMRTVDQDDLSNMDCEGIIGRNRYSKQDTY